MLISPISMIKETKYVHTENFLPFLSKIDILTYTIYTQLHLWNIKTGGILVS